MRPSSGKSVKTKMSEASADKMSDDVEQVEKSLEQVRSVGSWCDEKINQPNPTQRKHYAVLPVLNPTDPPAHPPVLPHPSPATTQPQPNPTQPNQIALLSSGVGVCSPQFGWNYSTASSSWYDLRQCC